MGSCLCLNNNAIRPDGKFRAPNKYMPDSSNANNYYSSNKNNL